MTPINLSQKLRALYADMSMYADIALEGWEQDFIAEAYRASLGGERVFHLSQKQQENIATIFERVYQ